MTINDLIPIGKLGKSLKDDPGFLIFKPGRKFMSFYLDSKDIFLIFTDYRVRFVTIDSIREDKNIWIRLKEKDVTAEIIEARSVTVALPKDDIEQLHSQFEDDYIIGFQVQFNDKIIGSVIDVQDFGAHDIIVVKDTCEKEYMIPNVKQYIISIDKKNQLICVQNVEDLLTL